MVGLHSIIPADAFTADTLGIERAGNGVLIGNGLVLTIGYLITEAETIWLHLGDGRVVEGHALGFDQETGFGLVQALARLDLPVAAARLLKRRRGRRTRGGRRRRRAHALARRPHRRQAGIRRLLGIPAGRGDLHPPAHPNWGGTGLISPAGELIGIGSLQLERAREGKNEHLNMIVPIDLLKPILDDLRKFGRVNKPVRPWLGLYSTEIEDKIVVVGIAPKGPAARAEFKTGDVVLAVKGEKVSTLADFYRKVWSLGDAGVEVPLTLYREGVTFDVAREFLRPRQVFAHAAAALRRRAQLFLLKIFFALVRAMAITISQVTMAPKPNMARPMFSPSVPEIGPSSKIGAGRCRWRSRCRCRPGSPPGSGRRAHRSP